MLARRTFLQAALAVQKRIERGVATHEGAFVGWIEGTNRSLSLSLCP